LSLEDQLTEFGMDVLSREQKINEQSRIIEDLHGLSRDREQPAFEQSEIVKRLEAKITQLQSKVATKRPDPRYVRNLQKIIIATVCDAYGHKRGAKKAKAISDLLNALAVVGLEVSDDTIRKILNESEKHLPEDHPE